MKKKKKKTKAEKFVEKHPLLTLATLPISLPLYVASEMHEESKSKRPKSVWLPRDVRQMDGYQFEEYVARRLASAGYVNIDVTPKSGDFGADIIAYKRFTREKVCFQCKKYSKPVGVKAVQEVIGAMAYYNCSVGCVVSVSGFTQAATNLASKSRVMLKNVEQL